MTGEVHIDFLCLLSTYLPITKYLELGVCDADCLNQVAPIVLGRPGSRAIGVDRNPCPVVLCSGVQFYCMSTQLYLQSLEEGVDVFDLVFIDADHDIASVLSDLRGVLPFVANDGIVALHDTYPKDVGFTQAGYCGSAYKIAAYWKEFSGIEFVTLPVHPGLTIIRKRKAQVPWMEVADVLEDSEISDGVRHAKI